MSHPQDDSHAFLRDDGALRDVADPAVAAPEDVAPRLYRHVCMDTELAPAAFLPLEKAGKLYVARLARPVLVQTPALGLLSGLNAGATHAHLALPPGSGFERFARQAEERVLAACLANKADWFKRRTMQDDALRASFKQFCKQGQDSWVLKVAVSSQVAVFDAAGRPATEVGDAALCLLELSKVCFGRTEFGAMWTLVQARAPRAPPPPPKCMIHEGPADAGDEAHGEEDTPDTEVHEFL